MKHPGSQEGYYRTQSTIIILLTLALLLSFFVDRNVAELVIGWHDSFFNFFFAYITSYIVVVAFSLGVPTVWLWLDQKYKAIVPLWMSVFFAVMISYLIKIIVQRPRPTDAYVLFANTNSSFPSLHTSTAFATLAVLHLAYPQYTKYFIIFGLFVAASRMYFGLHYLSDTIAGVLFGYGIGFFIVHLYHKKHLF